MSIIACKINSLSIKDVILFESLSFTLDKGDLLLLTGRSGSGKTTLLNAIGNASFNDKFQKYIHYDGTIEVNKKIRVSYVSQNPDSNIITNDVMSELILNANEDIHKVKEVINKYGIGQDFLESKTKNLSGGQIQFLAVICGFLQGADLFLLDEPLSMLDKSNKKNVLALIYSFMQDGKSFIVTSHNPDQFHFSTQRLELNSLFINKPDFNFNEIPKFDDIIYLQIHNLVFYYKNHIPLIKDISLNLKNGDILLVSGSNGSGKTTLAKLIAGILKPKKGVILLSGKSINKIRNYLPTSFSYSLQNPSWQLLYESVEQEISYCPLNFNPNNLQQLNSFTNICLSQVLINKEKEPRTLSFGQKKFITNFSYLNHPLIHFFDEPDLALDESLFEIFYKYLLKRKEKGAISIIASHRPEKFENIITQLLCL